MPAGPHSRLPQTSSAAEGKPTVDNSRSNGGAADLFDRTVPDEPLDVLAQQIVAEVCAREWNEEELFALARRAWPRAEALLFHAGPYD